MMVCRPMVLEGIFNLTRDWQTEQHEHATAQVPTLSFPPINYQSRRVAVLLIALSPEDQ